MDDYCRHGCLEPLPMFWRSELWLAAIQRFHVFSPLQGFSWWISRSSFWAPLQPLNAFLRSWWASWVWWCCSWCTCSSPAVPGTSRCLVSSHLDLLEVPGRWRIVECVIPCIDHLFDWLMGWFLLFVMVVNLNILGIHSHIVVQNMELMIKSNSFSQYAGAGQLHLVTKIKEIHTGCTPNPNPTKIKNTVPQVRHSKHKKQTTQKHPKTTKNKTKTKTTPQTSQKQPKRFPKTKKTRHNKKKGVVLAKIIGAVGATLFGFLIVYDTQQIFGSAAAVSFGGGAREVEYSLDMYVTRLRILLCFYLMAMGFSSCCFLFGWNVLVFANFGWFLNTFGLNAVT